ncbi:restriction endonuclease subunit S [Helicobacter pylori]|nr:restriction endonuclease subunit S [Helicobacter pylori]
MHKIERLLQTLAPKGVEFRKLGEVCESTNKKTLKISEVSEVKNKGMYPVINSGRDLYGYYHDFNNDGENITIASRGEYAGFINYFNEKFFAGGLCYPYKVKDTNELLTKFLYFYLKTNEIQIMENLVFRSSIPALNKADIETLTIPIPPLEIQQEIVKILDAFTELNTELNARKKQYQYYQNMLLDFNDINQNHKDAKEKLTQKPYPKRLKTLLQTLVPKGVEFRKLGDIILSLKTGLNPRKFFKLNTPNANNYYVTVRELEEYTIKFTHQTDRIDDNALSLCLKRSNLEKDDILFSGTGTIGKVSIIKENPNNWAIKEGIYSIKPNKKIVFPRFLMFCFENLNIQNDIKSKSFGGIVKSISMNDLQQITIPIPPLEIQQEIVKILDQFSILTTDLLAGIPAEIKARKKQYEYYREKLLTFKPLTPHKEVKK